MRTWSDLKSVEMQGIHLDIYLFFSFSDGHFRVEKIGSLGGKISPTLSSVFAPLILPFGSSGGSHVAVTTVPFPLSGLTSKFSGGPDGAVTAE